MNGLWLHKKDKDGYLAQYLSYSKNVLLTSVEIEKYQISKIKTIDDIYKIVKQQYDFITLPLSLANHISIAIAEAVHQLKLNTLLILVSKTEVHKENIFKIFDVYFSEMPNPPIFFTSLKTTIVKRIDGDDLDKSITSLCYSACFSWGGSHPDLFRDYRRGPLFLAADQIEPYGNWVKLKYRVFISYSHADKRFVERLLLHLKPLEKEGYIETFSDLNIKAGEKWFQTILDNIGKAHYFILFISADFLASDFVNDFELPDILEIVEHSSTMLEHGHRLIPIYVSSCNLTGVEITKYQGFNSPDYPLLELSDAEVEKLLTKVAQFIIDDRRTY